MHTTLNKSSIRIMASCKENSVMVQISETNCPEDGRTVGHPSKTKLIPSVESIMVLLHIISSIFQGYTIIPLVEVKDE